MSLPSSRRHRPAALPALCLALLLFAPAAEAQDEERELGMAASVEAHTGLFGIFNINQEFTHADPYFGATLAYEVDVHEYFAVGGEADFVWIKSQLAERHRLAINPRARVRFNVEVEGGLSVFAVVAVGLAVWPEDDSEAALHPALNPTRVGWSLRALGGAEYAFDSLFSMLLGVGYAMTASFGDDVAATVDCMQITLGARFRFGST